jgi:hypothetical protein
VESNQEVVREELMTEHEFLMRGIEPQFTREGVFFRRRGGCSGGRFWARRFDSSSTAQE